MAWADLCRATNGFGKINSVYSAKCANTETYRDLKLLDHLPYLVLRFSKPLLNPA